MIASIDSTSISGITNLETIEEKFGFMFARILFIYLSIWLIATGINKRRSKREVKSNKEK